MRPSTRRHSEEDWLSRKPAIRDMFLRDRLSIRDIVRDLASEDFYVTKHQLEYKLKEWNFRKKMKKTIASDAWQYIDHQRKKRSVQGKNTEVLLSGTVLDRHKVERESARYRRFIYGPVPSPEPPEGLRLVFRTPSPAPSAQKENWRASMPWIQFQSSQAVINRALSSTRNCFSLGLMANQDVSLEALFASLDITHHHLQHVGGPQNQSISYLVSDLQNFIPELYRGEAPAGSSIISTGSSAGALQQQIAILLFALSNKRVHFFNRKFSSGRPIGPVLESWNLILGILERSGLMSVSMNISGDRLTSESTLLAARETLFQEAFALIFWRRHRNSATLQDYLLLEPRIVRVIEWLLQSGQDTQTQVTTLLLRRSNDFVTAATPLQIAFWICHHDLIKVLLENGADPNQTLTTESVRTWAWPEPPIISLALGATRITEFEVALQLLRRYGAHERTPYEPSFGFCYSENLLTAAAGHPSNDLAYSLVKRLLNSPVAENAAYFTPDAAVAAAWQGNDNVLQYFYDLGFDISEKNEHGITAIQAAAYRGKEQCCKYLLTVGAHKTISPSFPSTAFLACCGNLKSVVSIVRLLYEHGVRFDCSDVFIQGDFLQKWMKRHAQKNILDEEFWKPKIQGKMYILPTPMEVMFSPRMEPRPDKTAQCCGVGCGPDRANVEVISSLLSCGAKLTSSVAAVATAADYGDEELLLLMLRAGSDPNICNKERITPLDSVLRTRFSDGHEACKEKYLRMAYALVEAGATISRANAALAAKFGNENLIRSMLSNTSSGRACDSTNHATYREAFLLEAVLFSGHLRLAKEILKRSEIYCPYALCAATLQAVANRDYLPFVTQLLGNRSQCNPSTEFLEMETTALGIAACFEDTALLEILRSNTHVHHVARWPSLTFNSQNPELITYPEDMICIKQYLISLRTKRDVSEAYWRSGSNTYHPGSVLRFAASSAMHHIVKQLLEFGYKFDWTSISMICQATDYEYGLDLIKGHNVLLSSEMDLDPIIDKVIQTRDCSIIDRVRNSCGNAFKVFNRPLRQAIKSKQLKMVEKILDAGPKHSFPNTWYFHPLREAVDTGQLSVVKLLFERGAGVNCTHADGFLSPLEVAAVNGHIDMITLLLGCGVLSTGDGQRWYLSAILAAERCGHAIAAAILRSYQAITADHETILNDLDYLYRERSVSDKTKDTPEKIETNTKILGDDLSTCEDTSENGVAFGEGSSMPAESTNSASVAQNVHGNQDTLLSFDDALEFHSADEVALAYEVENSTLILHDEPSSGIFELGFLFDTPHDYLCINE